jgi:RNA polymerase sigma-70 factor (ECF subfamily)
MPATSSAGAQEDRLALKEVQTAIGHLPAEQRVALFMVVLEGHSYEAAAEVTGCVVVRPRARSSGRGGNSRPA